MKALKKLVVLIINEILYEFGNQASMNQQYFMFHHIRVKLPLQRTNSKSYIGSEGYHQYGKKIPVFGKIASLMSFSARA